MSTNISKVYLFLAQQGGIQAADKNGDGYVIKSEFREFMEDNFTWDGETTDAGKNDLINTFWKSIDTNQSGTISGTRLKNKNALDKKEMEAMNVKLEIYEKLNEYLEGIEAPTVVNDQYTWKRSLSESLSNFVENYIKQGGDADKLKEALDKELPAAKARTTADYAAKDYIEEVLSDISNYARSDDKTLKGIIDKYIAEIKKLGNENLPSDQEIVAKVKKLVDAYLATAKIGNGNVTDLANYGYSPKNNSAMNDLQKAVLMTEALNSVKADAEEKAKFDMSNDGYKAALHDYIDSLKYADFENLQGSILENFKNSSFYATIQEKVDAANLEKARNEAIKYCDSIYNKGERYQNIVRKYFGDDYKTSINNMDTSKLNELLDKIKKDVEEIKSVSDMTDAEKSSILNGLNNMSVIQDEVKTIQLSKSISLSNTYLTPEYKASGYLSVDSNTGLVTVNTSVPGTYNGTIVVYIDGEYVTEKTVTITVKNKQDINNSLNNIQFNGDHPCCGERGYENAIEKSITNIKTFLDTMKTTAVNAGINQAKAQAAYDTLVSYYSAALHAVNVIDNNGSVGSSFNYYDSVSGKYVNCSDNSAMKSARDNSDVNSMADIKNEVSTSSTGLYIGHDKERGGGHANDKFYIYLDKAVVWEKFKQLLIA